MDAIIAKSDGFSKNNPIYPRLFMVALTVLTLLSIYYLKPSEIVGDGVTYEEAIYVLQGEVVPLNFIPNRILTTFLGLESVIVLGKIFGSIKTGWIILNIIFYFVYNIVFYKLILKIFKSDKTALLSGLFLAGSYASISFGLNYLMDIGGWTFYLLSLYFLYSYIEESKEKDLILASLSVGIGALFKEYAILGFLPIFFYLFYKHRFSILFVKKTFLAGILAFTSLLLVYIYVYFHFGYTYLNWLSQNKSEYVYHSRIVEYIKSFGSLVNFLGFLFFPSLYFLWKDRNTLEKNTKIFIILGVISFLPIFVWPAITQRILFIVVPTLIVICSVLFKKYDRLFPLFTIVLLFYIVSNFFMDSFLLDAVNLPF